MNPDSVRQEIDDRDSRLSIWWRALRPEDKADAFASNDTFDNKTERRGEDEDVDEETVGKEDDVELLEEAGDACDVVVDVL